MSYQRETKAALRHELSRLAKWEQVESCLQMLALADEKPRRSRHPDSLHSDFVVFEQSKPEWPQAVRIMVALGLIELYESGALDILRLTEAGKACCRMLRGQP